jgi:uroporphyrin-III C-methyltransferase/precorrin-2 dehydrogenase/sirohydrochlorin ferrochelatase
MSPGGLAAGDPAGLNPAAADPAAESPAEAGPAARSSAEASPAGSGGGPAYPIALDLAGRAVVVVGGGNVALRRTRALVEAGAVVTVIAPRLRPEFDQLGVHVVPRGYRDGDLYGCWLAHAATDDPTTNAAVAAAADQDRIWCVRADDASASAAWTPAVARHGDVTVAVTAGADPRRAAKLRAALALALAEGRLPLRHHRTAPAPVPPAASGEAAGASELAGAGELAGTGGNVAPTGTVTLIGGGPGESGLITVLGRRLLAEADVVVVDKLAPRGLLAELDPDVEVIDAGKAPHAHNLTQAQINDLIVSRARAGQRVVRLKGGDPFVFGRGGEEALACARAGVPVRVVPGVTSAVAVPAFAGIPVTHRGITQDFAVVSAHLDPSQPGATVDWESMARGPGTLVLLMGVAHLREISAELIKRGRDAATPVAVICDGTLPTQQVLTSTLGDVAGDADRAGLRPPAVVVIGEVVRLREVLMSMEAAA